MTTAQAFANIAFIKYRGNRDKALALTGSKTEWPNAKDLLE